MKRIQFEMSEKKASELERLMMDTDSPTKRELFNHSLTLLEWVINEVKNGRVIGAIDEGKDSYKELVMPFFSELRAEPHSNSKEEEVKLTASG